MMLCKFCREPSFLGEWNTPKETQNLPEKVCEVCGEKVDTDTLVQQREEKRGRRGDNQESFELQWG
jgi:hypothetical protein